MDAVSIMIFIFVVQRINVINDQRYRDIDDNVIEIKDFSIQLDDLQFNKYSQDTRILQMKLWLTLNDSINKDLPLTEQVQIMDINLSSLKHSYFFNIFKM